MKKTVLVPALAGIALLGLAGAASAAPAVMQKTANVRLGPSTGYPIVGKAYAGQTVNVQGCQAKWCYITKPGADGWVRASFLGRAPTGPIINFYLNFGRPPMPGPGPHPGPGPGPMPPHP